MGVGNENVIDLSKSERHGTDRGVIERHGRGQLSHY